MNNIWALRCFVWIFS